MTCVHSYSVVWKSFTALKVLFFPHSFLYQPLETDLFKLPSFTQKYAFKAFPCLSWLGGSFIFGAE